MMVYTDVELYWMLAALWAVCLLANCYMSGKWGDDFKILLDVAPIGAAWLLLSPAVTFLNLCRILHAAGVKTKEPK